MKERVSTMSPRCTVSLGCSSRHSGWVVYKVAGGDPQPNPSMWKTFAVYSGAMFQFAVCMAVFGYLGHRISLRVHHIYPTVAGVIIGVIVGASGLAFLAKQILGDRP